MKKIIIIILAVILLAVIAVLAAGIYRFNFTNDDIYFSSDIKPNPQEASYVINNQVITLKQGQAESGPDAGSSAKTITRYFGNEARGDFNGDGQEDIAFILTQENGGSGIFYYITVALASSSGYKGLNSILLGDRIAPQTTEIREGKIIVNYADRNIQEPMTSVPSLGVSKYFQIINNQLIELIY